MALIARTFAVVILLLKLASIPLNAIEPKYKISDIPAYLLTDAKAVIRNCEIIFEITDINKAVKKVTYAITILNENGLKNSVFTEYYDKYLNINKIKYDLFDLNGVAIKNGANVDIKDYSANVGYALFEDNRVKYLDPKWRTIPFTVEYSYEVIYHGLLNYPEWEIYDDFNISVEKSKFTIIAPTGFKIRYLEKNINENCKITEEKNKTKYTWQLKNMPAVQQEPYSKSIYEYLPVVYSAPSDFEIGGYYGNMDTWENFGEWIYSLGRGRNYLSPETRNNVMKMVAGLDSNLDKIKVLYDYFQNKVRYVSVQKGIGSWQPIEAEKVDRLSYGDCKALSNYMKSLLEAVGIPSYYTLVEAGEFATILYSEFPSNQFNHVILCVPIKNDTIWLECTSQHIPFGYLGTFTDDRKGLLINENGGTLVKTRKYSINDNMQIRNVIVELSPEGNGSFTVQTDYSGTLYDKMYGILHMDEIDKKNSILSNIALQSINLIDYSYIEEKSQVPKIKETLVAKQPGLGILIGNRMLIKPNLLTGLKELPYRVKKRESEIYIRRGFINIDTVIFKIPVGSKVNQIPAKTSIKTKFGEYSNEILPDRQGFKYIRILKIYETNSPIIDYPDFVDFFEKVTISDNNKIVIIKDV